MKTNSTKNEKYPDPKELEKELGEFLSKKFGGNVRLSTPIILPQENIADTTENQASKTSRIRFDLRPEDLVAYLDQYIIKQDAAKAIIATKICTHFNRIRQRQTHPEAMSDIVGSIKNNILMLGPTGVGKTYMIRLIAHKIGVPFVKGDATKFSETGYVGGDVEDLVRDLVRESDGDLERAQYGIIYIDEIDKIASAHNLIGADVSRTGVQRALLKPMEETDVDLKVPHDPISMLQEIERYRKTGKREKSTVNTKNILFIMSGAFSGLDKIIKKRVADQVIGFGASIGKHIFESELMSRVRSEDLISYGFESEFVGRLPVRAVFEQLSEEDLAEILLNPNNPIILSKKMDFDAYGILIKFEREAMHILAHRAYKEHTGARGLVSAVEQALLVFEKHLPSTRAKLFAVTRQVLEEPTKCLDKIKSQPDMPEMIADFEKAKTAEIAAVRNYISVNKRRLSEKYAISLTNRRIDLLAVYYGESVMDIETVLSRFSHMYDQIKTIEMRFFKNHGLNIILEEEAFDHIIAQWLGDKVDVDAVYKKLSTIFEYGLKLVKEKTGRNRFFITPQALEKPEEFIGQLLKQRSEGMTSGPIEIPDAPQDKERNTDS
jgi:endopeptidase Clp ATP-binding regulatory subunit ClpX